MFSLQCWRIKSPSTARAGALFALLLIVSGGVSRNAFDPAAVVINTTPPPVVLTEVLEMGKTVPLASHFEMPRLHYRDVVSFEFAALDFAAARTNSFACKLEGFDRDWERAGTRHRVSYTNLPDGHWLRSSRFVGRPTAAR
jgi:hypothetical protein